MKISKKLWVLLLTMMLCIGMIVIPVYAASTTQDGLTVSLTTDKESYNQGEDIVATLSVTNTNETDVYNVSLENIVPEGYKLTDDAVSTKKVDLLKAGETVSFTVTYVASNSDTNKKSTNVDKKESTGTQKTNKNGNVSSNGTQSTNKNGNTSNTGTQNTNKNGSAASTGSGTKTGDSNNVIIWITLLIIAMSGLIIFIIVKKKSGRTLLSLVLCITVAGTVFTGVSTEVRAEDTSTKTLSVQTEVSVSGDALKIAGIIKYEMSAVTAEDEADSDKDGLLDIDEAYFGTDPLNPDTDGDGLSDYEELLLGTDPLVANDYDKTIDTDADGLLDVEEASSYHTDPFAVDTDADGLSDYEEIKTYSTDPLSEDTDSDTLSDKFEIDHGLNPNSAYSDGTTYDGEKKIEQSLTDSAISKQLLSDDNFAKPTISGEANGELSNNVFLATSPDTTIADDRAVIGKPVFVDCDADYANGLTLSFDLSAYEGNTESLVIVSVDDEGNYVPLDSSMSGTIISASLLGNGTYLVLDLDEFLSALGIDVDGEDESVILSMDPSEIEEENGDDANAIIVETENESEETIEAAAEEAPESTIEETQSEEITEAASEETELSEFPADMDESLLQELNEVNDDIVSASVSGQADIVFAIDTTGSMSSTINNVVTNVASFATSLSKNYNVAVNYALVDFKDLEEDGSDTTTVIKNGSSNWFSNVDTFVSKVQTLVATGGGDTPECDIDALETARRLDWRKNSNKFIILITDTYYKTANNYGVASMDDEIKLLSEDDINTSVVTASGYKSYYEALYDTTGGIYANIGSSSFSSSLLALADLIGEKTSNGTWAILKHGYKYVKLTDDDDQDGDGLSTAYELGDEQEVDLTFLIKACLALHGVPYETYSGKTSITVYNAKSDPTMTDTDSDGILDKDDDAPWKKGYADGSIGEMKLLAVTGDEVCTVAMEYLKYASANTGHSFLIYQSYVNDELDLSSWNGGYVDNSGSWVGAIAQTTPDDSYKLKVNDVFAFSAGGNADFSASCAIYNMEFYKHKNSPFYTYSDNRYISEKVTQTQLEKMMNVMNEEAKKDYNPITHQCTHVSLNVWNTMYETDIDPFGLNTPTNLYSWLNKHGADADFNLDTITK